MPGVIGQPTAIGTLPHSLSTKFAEAHSVLMNMNQYHDLRSQRVALVTGGRKSWKISKRLDAHSLGLLRQFCYAAKGGAFYFYNPSETNPPYSNNPSGTAGRYLVRFNSDWSQTTGMSRSETSIELVEVSEVGATDIGAPIVPDGGTPAPPPPPATNIGTGVLYISDGIVYTGAGQSGSFTFLTDAAFVPPWLFPGDPSRAVATGLQPPAGWIGTVAVEVNGVFNPDPELHIRYGLSVTITPPGSGSPQTVSLGTFAEDVQIEGGLQVEVKPKSLYPPLNTSTAPVFHFDVISGSINDSVASVSFGMSLLAGATPDTVYVGWPREHMDPGGPGNTAYLASLRDGLYHAGSRTIPSVWAADPADPLAEMYYTPPYLDYVGGPITPALNSIYDWNDGAFDVMATQSVTFTSVTLRLIGLDSYFATSEIPSPAEVSLGGLGCWVNVRVAGATYVAKLFDAPVTVSLGAPVSVAANETAVTLEVIGADPDWFNQMMPSGILIAPYPLISVVLS